MMVGAAASGLWPTSCCHSAIVNQSALYWTFACVNRMTKQEQMVLCIIIGLLLTGWAVKTYRAAHPPAQAAETSEP